LYCDFYSDTDLVLKRSFLEALRKEMELRKAYPEREAVETIYFGGGTPSQLSPTDFEVIFTTIYRLFPVKENAEITLEGNPDDLTEEYIRDLCSLPFNRISMGVQSFYDSDLHFLERRHNSQQAIRAISLFKTYGFENISIDLMYGLPGQTQSRWEENLEEALKLNVPHISAYHLTYEKGTRLYQLLKKEKIHPVDEETSIGLFSTLIHTLEQAGYTHYELSNFAKPGNISLHNSSYWTGKKYLGIGPSAHSYNGKRRQWNIASIRQYMEGINHGSPFFEEEILNLHERYNDYVITGLRTMWGIDLSVILTNFGKEMQKYCLMQAASSINRGMVLKSGDKLLLSRMGMFISDSVMSDLLWV
jgi:oxygen-independent coproporphyrinogen-3 oxidase